MNRLIKGNELFLLGLALVAMTAAFAAANYRPSSGEELAMTWAYSIRQGVFSLAQTAFSLAILIAVLRNLWK